MRRLRAPLGLRGIIGIALLACNSFGCASMSRGPIMTPAGPRWLGPADPIAAGRPPAITFDPYQPDGIPRPQGLARFFPGPSVASPSTNRPTGPVDRSPMATAPTALAARSEPPTVRRSRHPASTVTLAARSKPNPSRVNQKVPILPAGIVLETYPPPAGQADPETRLASRREEVDPAPGSFDLPDLPPADPLVVDGVIDVPDLNEEPTNDQLIDSKKPLPTAAKRRRGFLGRLFGR
jgi:hypothetical protein